MGFEATISKEDLKEAGLDLDVLDRFEDHISLSVDDLPDNDQLAIARMLTGRHATGTQSAYDELATVKARAAGRESQRRRRERKEQDVTRNRPE